MAESETSRAGVAQFKGVRGVCGLLSHEKPAEHMAMVVVAPASTDISDIAVEVNIGIREGHPGDGVDRVALPRLGKINCSWLVTLRPADLIEQVAVPSPTKLREFDEVLVGMGCRASPAKAGAMPI